MQVEDLFEKLKPVYGERIERLWWEYRLNPDSRREIEAVLHSLAAKQLGQGLDRKPILLVPPPADVADGEYRLGTVMYAGAPRGSFGLREHELIMHCGILGRTGAGKTNVGFLLLRELSRHGKPWLVCDWKRNYRDLLALPEFSDVGLYTVGRSLRPFSFNPLAPPPGTQPTVWLKKLIEIMCHVYWLGEGVAYLLQNAIDAAYVNAAKLERPPTLADVKAHLEARKVKGREAQWMESTLRALGTLCYGEMGRVVNAEVSTDLRQLLNGRVILELDALSNSDKTFLIESLLLWIHHFRLQDGRRETFKHAVFIEEAHHVLLKRKQSKETIMDVVFREIRELGEALVFLDQHPSLVSLPSLGNAYTTMAFNVKHGADVRAIGDAMLLNDEQREYVGRLETGQAVVRLQGRWHQPFLVEFPLVSVAKGSVTDGALEARFGGASGHSTQRSLRREVAAEVLPIRAGDKGRDEEGIGSDGEVLLRDVAEHPTDGVAQRFRRLGFSAWRGYRVLDNAVAKGLLNSATISTPWGATRFLWTSLEGAAAVGLTAPPAKNESPEHLFWKLRVAEELQRRGYEVKIEVPASGHVVDVLAAKGGETVAVEVETGKSERSLQRGSGDEGRATIVVATTRSVAERLRAKSGPSHLCIVAMPEFLTWLAQGPGSGRPRSSP